MFDHYTFRDPKPWLKCSTSLQNATGFTGTQQKITVGG
jgi:hypothetical protein